MSNLDLSNYLVIDTETSGLAPKSRYLLSVALVSVDDPSVRRVWYVGDFHPDTIVWDKTAREYFNKYEPQWFAEKQSADTVLAEIESWLAENFPDRTMTLVGHNVGFDKAFLSQLSTNIKGLSHRTIDTHTLLWLLHTHGRIPVKACSSTGAFRYFDVNVDDDVRHTAVGDAVATRELFLKVMLELTK